MFLNRHIHTGTQTLRICGLLVAYAFVLVTGTAILIAAFGAVDDGRATASSGPQLTAAEMVIEQVAIHNDKRGF